MFIIQGSLSDQRNDLFLIQVGTDITRASNNTVRVFVTGHEGTKVRIVDVPLISLLVYMI